MDISEIAYQISSFIEKYHNDSTKVEWPNSEFKTKLVSQVMVQDTSLKFYANELWTFEAKATITKTATNVTITEEKTIIGNAHVNSHLDGNTNKENPEVRNVVITKINNSSNTSL